MALCVALAPVQLCYYKVQKVFDDCIFLLFFVKKEVHSFGQHQKMQAGIFFFKKKQPNKGYFFSRQINKEKTRKKPMQPNGLY